MLFNTFDFLLFFVLVFVVQLVLPHRPRNLWLLAASCFFYGCWDWRFLGLMFVTITTDFSVSHAIARTASAASRKRLLAVSCAVNLAILGFFKYFNFFAGSAEAFIRGLGIPVEPWQLNVVLPVGISFYTFQSMSYTIDVYRQSIKPLPGFTDYALYVTLFPQLVAGPIERGTHLAAQVVRRPAFSWPAFQDGTWLVLKGLFKKAVIADNLAPIVTGVFAQSEPSGPEVLLGVYAFAFQIYGDFSGYSDIARGTAKMLGYDLMMNFRLPYFAVDPSDFWRRWHISLSTWLRDYLYIPLGGSRGGLGRTCRNLMITMVLGGLWHGAAWNFVLWGFYHGAILVGYRLGSGGEWSVSDVGNSPLGTLGWLARVFLMFHLTCLGWLLFRAESVAQIGDMLAALTGPWMITEQVARSAWQIVLLCGPLVMVQLLEERTKNLNLIPCLSLVPRTLAYAATLVAILTLGSVGGREFIYFQF